MKRLILIAFAAGLAGCMSVAYISTPAQEKELEAIREVQGLSKAQLFARALEWVARTYNSAQAVIQLKDEAAGQIVCRGIGQDSFDIGILRSYSYTLIIDVKDGKVRFRVENIQSEKTGTRAGPNLAYDWPKIRANIMALRTSFFATLERRAENW